ncbi:MAG: DNA-directed RNA polymerase subunit omega [Mariprofundales bacterium]|nr:DNA-directed RNA polymerase subunit omega [Mariprofundales bacterium]
MARVTIEDCTSRYPNRFEMTVLASRRARQLLNFLPPLMEHDANDKPTVQALREVGAGVATWEMVAQQDQVERDRLAAEEDFAAEF